nr:uncharacterized protein LOC109175377 [Ipomoea batatas]
MFINGGDTLSLWSSCTRQNVMEQCESGKEISSMPKIWWPWKLSFFQWLDFDVTERVAQLIRGLLKRLDKQQNQIQKLEIEIEKKEVECRISTSFYLEKNMGMCCCSPILLFLFGLPGCALYFGGSGGGRPVLCHNSEEVTGKIADTPTSVALTLASTVASTEAFTVASTKAFTFTLSPTSNSQSSKGTSVSDSTHNSSEIYPSTSTS